MKKLLLLILLNLSLSAFATITKTECKLNEGDWVECNGTVSYQGLPQGEHTFSIRSTDDLGNVSYKDYTWIIDTSGPTITIIKKPASRTNNTDAEFIFEVSDSVPQGDDLACNEAELSWEAPTARVDGTILAPEEIGGYKISWGLESKVYTSSITTAGDVAKYNLKSLGAGNNYFVIQTLDTNGLNSEYSDEVSKEINC